MLSSKVSKLFTKTINPLSVYRLSSIAKSYRQFHFTSRLQDSKPPPKGFEQFFKESKKSEPAAKQEKEPENDKDEEQPQQKKCILDSLTNS